MADTLHGNRAPLLLRAAIFLTAAAAALAQQNIVGLQGYLDYVSGNCPNYQTNLNFTQSYIDQMKASEQGYILALATGNSDACQKLSFVSDKEFNFSFIDIANFPRTFSSSYEINLANLTNPAQIKLNILPGLLGADGSGNLSLNPLLVDDEKLVVASCWQRGYFKRGETCWQRGYFKREQLQVFVPFPSTASVEAIKADLLVKEVYGAEALKEISQDCVAGVRQAPQPIPLRVYNLVLALESSSREPNTLRSRTVANSALEFYRNFQQQPPASSFTIPFSPFYQPTGAMYQQAGPVYQPTGAVYQQDRPEYQASGALFYSSPQGAGVNYAGVPSFVGTEVNKNLYTRFYS